jgi:transposase
MITDSVSKELFIKYLQDFSEKNPNELKIIVINNASFHLTKDIELPKNIVLLPLPPYCPDLNPAEKMWQWLKDRMAMKIYENLEELENKITHIKG